MLPLGVTKDLHELLFSLLQVLQHISGDLLRGLAFQPGSDHENIAHAGGLFEDAFMRSGIESDHSALGQQHQQPHQLTLVCQGSRQMVIIRFEITLDLAILTQ